MGDVVPIKRGKQRKISLRKVVADNRALIKQVDAVLLEKHRVQESNDRLVRYLCILAEREAERVGRCVVSRAELAAFERGDGLDFDTKSDSERIGVIVRRTAKKEGA